jgi:hypothetical protein
MEGFDRVARRLSLRLIVQRALLRWQRLSELSANPFIGEVARKGLTGEATTALESLDEDPAQPPEPR